MTLPWAPVVVKAARDFEDSMRKIQAIANTTAGYFADLYFGDAIETGSKPFGGFWTRWQIVGER